MILTALFPMLGLVVGPLGPLPDSTVAPATDRSPVRLWMSNDRMFREGDVVRLQVDAEVDGYLLVLNYDPFGRVRVLFPVDPRDDARVRAGRRYEVRDDQGRGAFLADGDGTGLIYSAVGAEPWRLDDIVLEGRWDYDRLSLDQAEEDPEAAITGLVQRLAGPAGFDYDVLGYRVEGNYSERGVIYRGYGPPPVYLYDDYLFCNNWYWRSRGCNRYPYDGGWYFGLSFGSHYYNDPWYYGYRPYGYGYGGYGGYGYGYPSYYPYYPGPIVVGTRTPRAVIGGRPRGYTVTPIPRNDVGAEAGARPFGNRAIRGVSGEFITAFGFLPCFVTTSP